MTDEGKFLEVIPYTGDGYAPLLFSAGWQVAILNCEPLIDLASLSEIERHAQTVEVFGLWRGRAALFVKTDDGISLVDLQPGVIYNVTAGTWHNLIATRDVSLWIVENRDTHAER
jgi:mannose-6-phosphate isomerase-like protein (cupin superfamily)